VKNRVTVVAGLPRSGTSMMMRMLESGGMPVLTDKIRVADDDNPRGYYEYERVKKIDHDRTWLEDAKGRAVKMVSALLVHLPADIEYKLIFMRRAMPEILASQHKMLVHRRESTDAVDRATLTHLFANHLTKIMAWIESQPNMDVLYVSYNDVLADPDACAQEVNRFLGGTLDAEAMAMVVDPDLYRNRQE
jgi:Sulfotransferase domain